MASLNALPNELLPFIFKYMESKDLLNCRLVCRRFKFFCHEAKVTELVVSDEILISEWFYTCIKNKSESIIGNLSILNDNQNSTPIFNLKYLRRLMIYPVIDGHKFKLDALNKFQFLENLDIELIRNCEVTLINLPNLKTLYIGYADISTCFLTIDAPNLEAYLCDGESNQIKFSHPETIKYLETHLTFMDYEPFRGVEMLCCNNGVLYVDKEILSYMPNLRELHFREEMIDYEDYRGAKESIREIISKKRLLGRNNLKIYFMDSFLVRDRLLSDSSSLSNCSDASINSSDS